MRPKDQALDVWGEFACFYRPELKVERLSYPIITPSAARGIFDAIYSKPNGDQAKADAVYAGVAEPLTSQDVAECVAWVSSRPAHVNIDRMIVRPRAQAANHKFHRVFG